ncbi:MAG: glycosyltransferase family 1 protein [Anaerolineaceae bacterium]|nr:glycosyltransferase family 1 protein [Anaerolineaceae bacterium]
MTHLTILALGSRGDVLPCAVLGQGLQAAGFAVRLISSENFAPMAVQYGLDFYPVPGDAEALLTSGGGVTLAESGQSVWKMWRSVKALFWEMATGIADVLSQAELWQTDAIINQLPGGLFGVDLAEKLQIPLITMAVIPMMRTHAFPMVAFPPKLAFLPGYNALSYRLAEQLVWSGFRRAVNRWRQETLGLAARPFLGRFYQIARLPTLLGFSEAIVPRPPDWGQNVHYTGYWRPEEPEWTPPDALVNFLAAGSAPIFVGFGSMPVRQPQQVTQVVLEALRQTGQRAVLQAGWAGIGQSELPDTVYLLDYAPYGWLFPKMAAVVHHGGSGTTGFGFWAGVPTLLIPFLFDQFYWGRRIEALGVGPAAVPFKTLTAAKLARALEAAVSDTAMRQKAAALGEKIRQEDGVATAVRLIEQFVRLNADKNLC